MGQTVQSGVIVYEAEFFAGISPRTALDMVERVPGFVIDDGEDRRGFSGAQGNVLIDGEPPASKAQELDDILSRIPASDVARIELLRGAGSNAGSGQPTRVNIVRRPGSGEGVWEVEFAHARDGRVTPSAEAAWTGRRGDFEYGVSTALAQEHLPVRGVRSDFDAGGALDDARTERVPSDERESRLAGEASFPWAGGALALNAQLSRGEYDELELARLTDALGVFDGTIDTDLAEQEDTGELGLSFRRDFGAWRGELTSVLTRRRFDGDETTIELDELGVLDEAARQTQRIESDETILRAVGRRDLSVSWRIELAAEAALTTLEQRLTLTEDDGSGPRPVVLPSANVRVEEERAEASFMLAGAPTSRWTLETGVAAETSRLSQSGDVNQEIDLTYWKPSFRLSRAIGERDQLRLRLYRDVGQLDFEDFVSAADITSSIIDGGNPDLRPETSWRLEFGGDWRFGEDGAFGLTFYRWWIEDTLDIIPVGPPGDQFDARGNIGEADLFGARISLALPLPLDSGLRIEGMTQRSEVTDPLTGERREISAIDESAITLRFRQDIETIDSAWGIDFERERETSEYRLDRIEDEQDADDLTLWIETTAFGNLKLRAWASNLSDSNETRERRIFDPTRLGTFDGSDQRARGEGLTFGLSASGNF
ncbi:MAG: TonB-dependent receptor [Hyphomonadaceae bacterium]